MSVFPLKTSASPPIKLTTGEQHCETSIVLGNEGMGCRESHTKCSDAILHCNEDDTILRILEVRDDDDDDDDVAAGYSRRIEKESGVPVSSNAKGNEGHGDGELIFVCDSKNVEAVVHMTPYTWVDSKYSGLMPPSAQHLC